LAALLIGLLLGALDNFIVATALPTIATQLNDVSGQVFVVTSYLIAQTVAIPIFGKLSDRFGRRSFYLLGLGIFLVGSALSGLSQNLNELIAFRALQGLGSGAFFTVVFSIIGDLFPPKAAARLAGILSGVFGVAIVLGPLVGSYIVDTTTWRWIFFVNLPLGFLAVGLVLATMGPLRRSIRSLPFDTVGSVLLGTWVSALIFPLVMTSLHSGAWSWTDPRTLGLLVVAAVTLVLFLWQESRTRDPLIPLHYFRNRLIATSSGVNFLRGAALVGVVTFIPILVVEGLGGSTDLSRDVLYAFMVPMIVGAAIGGGLVPRTGYRVPVSIGMALAALGTFLLTTVPSLPPIFRFTDVIIPVGLAGALIPLGLGIGLTFAPTQLAIQYSVSREDIGAGNSLVWFLGNLGGSIVVSFMNSYQQTRFTSLLPSYILQGPSGFQHAFALSIHDVWWFLVPFMVAAFFFAVLVDGRLPSGTPSGDGIAEPVPAATG
jgi:EmrB/QacA subfamily drug resistance transporter